MNGTSAPNDALGKPPVAPDGSGTAGRDGVACSMAAKPGGRSYGFRGQVSRRLRMKNAADNSIGRRRHFSTDSLRNVRVVLRRRRMDLPLFSGTSNDLMGPAAEGRSADQ